IIRHSNSKYASPVILVRKKDGGWRLCVDYRKLNALTVFKPHPIPNIEEIVDQLGSARIFSSLDMEAGYNQVLIREKDRFKTAFITRDALLEFNRLPFGLVNAPFTFQKIMNQVFRETLYKYTMVYLDDILIYSENEETHMKHLDHVLSLCKQFNIKLNLEKCHFFEKKIEFLGFELEKGGN
ncbi:putative LTR retrotransposon, partial [Pseudoloma neurophilia]